jgi:hypothetical protein
MEFAVGSGLIQISGTVAVAGPVLKAWSPLADAEVLGAWQAGVHAVCEAESDTRRGQSVAILAAAFLEAAKDGSDRDHLWRQVIEIVERDQEDTDWSERMPPHALTQYLDLDTRDPFGGLVDLLGQARHGHRHR